MKIFSCILIKLFWPKQTMKGKKELVKVKQTCHFNFHFNFFSWRHLTSEKITFSAQSGTPCPQWAKFYCLVLFAWIYAPSIGIQPTGVLPLHCNVLNFLKTKMKVRKTIATLFWELTQYWKILWIMHNAVKITKSAKMFILPLGMINAVQYWPALFYWSTWNNCTFLLFKVDCLHFYIVWHWLTALFHTVYVDRLHFSCRSMVDAFNVQNCCTFHNTPSCSNIHTK